MADSNATISPDGQSITVRPLVGTVRPPSGIVPGPGEEHHLSLTIGATGSLKFIRRPMSTPAREGQIGFLDGLDSAGRMKREVAIYRDGEWRGGKGHSPLKITPLVWTVCAEMDAKARTDG
jgi:hypothetical protein